MDIQGEIIKTIDIMIAKRLEKSQISTDVASVVQEISGTKYKVTINGTKSWVKCGTNLSLNIGTPVWVHIPNGNINDAFILAYR